MIRTISLFMFLMISNTAFSAAAMKDSNDAASSSDATDLIYTQKAQELIPDSQEYPTQEQIDEVFQQHVDKSIHDEWVHVINMMFTKFGTATHPADRVIKGWRCLLVKVMKAKDAKDAPNTQWEALLDLLKLHKKSLEKLQEDSQWGSLAQKLQKAVASRTGCAMCAKKRLGADFLN